MAPSRRSICRGAFSGPVEPACGAGLWIGRVYPLQVLIHDPPAAGITFCTGRITGTIRRTCLNPQDSSRRTGAPGGIYNLCDPRNRVLTGMRTVEEAIVSWLPAA